MIKVWHCSVRNGVDGAVIFSAGPAVPRKHCFLASCASHAFRSLRQEKKTSYGTTANHTSAETDITLCVLLQDMLAGMRRR